MSKYAAEHADALADLADAGAAIKFECTASDYDSATDTSSNAVVQSISGQAIESKPNRDAYRRLGLTHQTAVTLFFAPDTIGALPTAGFSALWQGQRITVADPQGYAPDGVAIAAELVCRR